MNKTKIEWVKNPDGSQGYTLNSKTGCLNHTPGGLCLGGLFPCYAFRLANGRLKQRYLANDNIARSGYPIPKNLNELPCDEDDPFYPRFWPERLKEPYRIKKPSGLFLDDMSDWMGDYWPREWTEAELQMMRDNPQHRIYTLTKQPQNLIKFSPFPPNCFVGVTATDPEGYKRALAGLAVIQARVKYLSIEPFLEQIPMSPPYKLSRNDIQWLIIGAMTGTQKELLEYCQRYNITHHNSCELSLKPFGRRWTLQPKLEWVKEIMQADRRIPIFIKDNLKPIFPVTWQEMPKEARLMEK